MPNNWFVVVPPTTAQTNWAMLLAWRVPVNDRETLSLIVSRMPPKPARAGDGPERKPPEPDPYALVDDILAGRERVQDVDPDYPHIFTVQDNVVLAGRGAIHDRRGRAAGAVRCPDHPSAQDLGARAESARRGPAFDGLAPADGTVRSHQSPRRPACARTAYRPLSAIAPGSAADDDA